MIILVFSFLALAESFGYNELGSVQALTTVSTSITNRGESADYTFYFTLTHALSSGSSLLVVFPEEFPTGLGSITCSLGTCSVSQYTVTVLLSSPIASGASTSLIIYGVTNPAASGGTKSFGILTYDADNNLIDENLNFSVIGIAEDVGALVSAGVDIIEGGSHHAGDSTRFEFKFKLTRAMAPWNWIRFTFPADFTDMPLQPTCTAFPVNGFLLEGSLYCSRTDYQVTLYGISAEIPANTDVGVRVTGVNPAKTGITGDFTIETGRNSTYTVYERKTAVSGVQILPGRISNVKLTSLIGTMNKGKIGQYRLQFMPKNKVDGEIKLIFSSNFNMDATDYVEIESGLTDKSTTEKIAISYDVATHTLTVSSFAENTPTLVSMILQITNPPSKGQSDPIIIRTLQADLVTIIDENYVDAYVLIEDTPAPVTSISYPLGTQASGTNTQIEICITPPVEVPPSGFIKVNIPSGFSYDSTPVCYVQPAFQAYALAQLCTFLDDSITIQLNNDVGLVYGRFQAAVQSCFRLESIKAPTASGTYIFDYSTYDASSVLQQSGSVNALMTPSALSGLTLDGIHREISTETVLMASFTIGKEVKGYIEVSLLTSDGVNNLFASDLGMGLVTNDNIPCLGIVGINDIQCVFTVSTTPNTLLVTVSGFSSLIPGTAVEFHIPGPTYLQSANAASGTVTTYNIENGVRREIETASVSFPAGVAATAATATAVTPTLSDATVSASSSLSLGQTTSATTTTDSYILMHINPTHDEGFCQYASAFCRVNSIAKDCFCYAEVDMILIYLDAAMTPTQIDVLSLSNPESVETILDGLIVYVIETGTVLQKFNYNMPAIQAGTFSNPVASPSGTGMGYVFVRYSLELRPEHTVPAGGTLEVIFPAEFSFVTSSPNPYCTTGELTPLTGSQTTCSITGNTITVSNFQSLTANFLAFIYVNGVKNPSVASSSVFIFRSYNTAGRVIDEHLTVPGISFGNAWTPEVIQSVTIGNYPKNANATAEYTFSFVPSVYMGAGAIIEIDFPIAQFGTLSPPTCRLSGDMITFKTCTVSGSNLFVQTNADTTLQLLTISVFNLINFDEGTSNSFGIEVQYDGVIIQQTDSTTTGLVATTGIQAPPLPINKLDFYPKNAGELATYIIETTPAHSFSSTNYLTILFPHEYDHTVGINFDCSAEGLNGFLKCYTTDAYTVIVTNHHSFTACETCKITLYLNGVYNPNVATTSRFKIGISAGDSFPELHEYIDGLSMLAPPLLNDLIELTYENNYVGYESTFSLNLTTTQSIPASEVGGELWVRYASDYLLEGSNIRCRSSSYWSDGVPACSVLFDKVVVTGQNASFTGNLMLYVDNTPHPLIDGLAGDITLLTYDDFNSVIVDRSYPNLHPTQIEYVYPGPLIIVNSNQVFTVRGGTLSSYIPITLDYPAALNLTLVPSSDTGIVFYPEQIYIYIGDVFTDFRVGVEINQEDKEYVISWLIIGEVDPPYYTPLLKSRFEVDQDLTSSVHFEEIMPIPRGSKSLPIKVSLDNAPHSDLSVLIAISETAVGFTLSASQLEFTGGVHELYFTVQASESSVLTESHLNFTISGTDVEAFTLDKTSLLFTVFNDTITPEVTGILLLSLNRTSATFDISFNKVAHCYYAYALRDSEVPSFDEVKSQGPAVFDSTRTKYGTFRVFDDLKSTLVLDSLDASTKYTLYVYIEDLSGASSPVETSSFTTDSIYKPAEITLVFDQLYLNSIEIENIKSVIALLLSLHDWRVIEAFLSTTNDEQLEQSEENSSVITFYLVDHPGSTDYPRPSDMISLLGSKETLMNAMLTNVDTNEQVSGQEIFVNACEFSVIPFVASDSDHYNIYLESSLVEDGYIISTVILGEADPGIPFSFQVYDGHDRNNKPVLSQKIKVKAGETITQAYGDLEPLTTYNLYIICANDSPFFPELLPDDEMMAINWRTAEKPAPTPINLNHACILELALAFLFFI